MNKLFTLLLTAAGFTASAQIEVEYPYNPDNQNDGHVGIEDILEILTVYGEEFTPEQLLVEGTSLTEWIQFLSETVLQQQAQIDSLQSTTQFASLSDSLVNDIYNLMGQQQALIDSVVQLSTGGLSLGPSVDPPWPDFEGGSSVFWEEGTWDNEEWLDGVTGNVNSGWAFYYTPSEDGFLTGRAESRVFVQQLYENEERAILNIYDHSGSPSFCVPLAQGITYRIIRQSHLTNLSWTPFFFGGAQSEGNEGQAEGGAGPCQGEFTVNYHGYDYELVEIGDQCWFAENCRFLPQVHGLYSHSYEEPEAYVLGYDGTNPEEAKAAFYYDAFGVYYNLHAVIHWELCPAGWGVSSREDWAELETSILGSSFAPMALYSHLANVSGFTMHMTGEKQHGGPSGLNNLAAFWLEDWDEGFPMNFPAIRFTGVGAFSEVDQHDSFGLSVRCVKD